MSDELFIEISGSSNKAVSALDKVITKLSELQNKLNSATQKINSFTNSLKNISFSSGFKQLANDINTVSSALSKTNNASRLSLAMKQVAQDTKFAEEAQQSLNDAVSRAAQSDYLNTNNFTGPLHSPTLVSNSYSDTQAEIAALERTVTPEFDNSKIREALTETNEFINSLTPNLENMSVTAQNRFNGMAESLRGVNAEIERQKQLLSNLNSDFSTLSKAFGSDTSDFTEKIKATTNKIEQLTLQSENLKKSMQKLAQPAQTATGSIDKTSDSADKANESFSTFDKVIRNLKTYLIIRAINEISNAFSGALQNCIIFTENMNLFNMSLGENAETAGIFIDKMSLAFGMDSSGLVKTMGTFYQISHSMAVTSQNAYVLSENFTKLANDLSSFYNIPVNDAVVKLQAGLVGETEPLRRLGIIITENALKQTAANLGIQKSVESMSEAEKMHLRYITVLEQTKNVQGDFARTIESPAQSLKILGEQMSQLARSIGGVFMPVLGAVLPYLIAFARAITTVISNLAVLLGYKAPSYQNMANGFGGATSESDKLGDSIGKASAKAKEFKKLIMSFDELHILTDTKQPSGGSGNGAGASSDFAVPDLMGYDNLMDSVTSKTDEIYKNIMTFFESVGKLLEPTIAAFERLKIELDRLGQFAWQGLVDFYNSFLVPVGNWVFGEGLPRFIDAITNGIAKIDWSKITSSLNNLWESLAPYAVNVGENFLWLWENILVPLGSWSINDVLPTFLDILAGAIDILNVHIETARNAFDWFWNIFLEPIAAWTGGIIVSVLQNLADKLSVIGNWMSEHKALIENFTIVISSFALAWGIVTVAMNAWNIAVGIWNAIGVIATAVTTGFGAAVAILTSPITLVILAIGAVIAVIVLLIKHWDDIKKAAVDCWNFVVVTFNKIVDWFATNWQGLLLFLLNPFLGAFKLIYDNCEGFRNFIDNLVQVVAEFFLNMWDSISGFAKTCWDSIISVWNTVSGWFNKNIISPLKNLFNDLWNGIKNIFNPVANWFGNIFTNAYNAVTNAFSNVKNFFSGIWDTIKNMFTNIGGAVGNAIGGAFKTVVNSIISFAQNTINGFIRAINTAISVINVIPGVNVRKLSELSIPRLEKGGLATKSVLANIGEGKDHEAILPLNDSVYRKIAEGINQNNDQRLEVISEESFYRAFVRALQDAPEKTVTFIANLNSKVIAREVLKEQSNVNRRFSPVMT